MTVIATIFNIKNTRYFVRNSKFICYAKFPFTVKKEIPNAIEFIIV